MAPTEPKARVRYRPATLGWLIGQRCGTCVMFRPRTASCTLVKGAITRGAICDKWDGMPKNGPKE